jgi:hypothetical protein
MPILFMALLALLAFVGIGVLCFVAAVGESRQAAKDGTQQTSVPARKIIG